MAPIVGLIGAVASVAGAFAPLLQKPPKPPSQPTSGLSDELASRQANQESDAARTKQRDDARARQAALARGGTGRSDTILTTPLGEVGEATGSAPKTLLGG